jgi:hypothetical protein
MGKMTYNRSRYYSQSASTMLNDSREAHGKTLDELKKANELVKTWMLVADWFAQHYAKTNNISMDEALEQCYDDLEKGTTNGQ